MAEDRSAGGRSDGGRAPTRVTAYRDGPLIVRGDVEIIDHDGVVLQPGRRTIALFRCGRSAVTPFCDGSHVAAKSVAGDSAHRVEDSRDEDGSEPLAASA